MRPLLVAFALLLAVPLPASAQRPPGGPYLFELIERPAFRAAYDGLFRNERNVDAWIRDYTRTRDGPATPSQTFRLDGRTVIGAGVCKRHDCGDNQLKILFAEDGSRAVAVLTTSRGQRWFGNPTAAERSLLLQVD